jgi:hypothetical protein
MVWGPNPIKSKIYFSPSNRPDMLRGSHNPPPPNSNNTDAVSGDTTAGV